MDKEIKKMVQENFRNLLIDILYETGKIDLTVCRQVKEKTTKSKPEAA